MRGKLTVSELRDNIALSRAHLVKQEAVIARLTEQGHEAMAIEAKGILATMHEHLALELDMLDRLESE